MDVLPMTFPAFRNQLVRPAIDSEQTVAWRAVRDCTLGLLVATFDESTRSAVIRSVFVVGAERRRGLANRLLEVAENELQMLGADEVQMTFSGSDEQPSESVLALRRLLARRGWNEPRLHMYLVRVENANHDRLFEASWVRERAWPEGIAVSPWLTVSAEERRKILDRQNREGWYPESVSPFREPERVEPINSLVMRYRGEVAGWMVTHRIAADTIRYTSLFASPCLPFRGLGLRLLGEATRLQAIDKTRVRFGTFGIYADNPFAIVAHRRCGRYLTVHSVLHSWISSKRLSPPHSP